MPHCTGLETAEMDVHAVIIWIYYVFVRIAIFVYVSSTVRSLSCPRHLCILPILLPSSSSSSVPTLLPRPRRDPTRLQHGEPSLVGTGVRWQVLHGDDDGIPVPDAVVRRVDAERPFLELRPQDVRRTRGIAPNQRCSFSFDCVPRAREHWGACTWSGKTVRRHRRTADTSSIYTGGRRPLLRTSVVRIHVIKRKTVLYYTFFVPNST